MPYTSVTAVQSLLGANYGALADVSSPDLQQYIDSADMMIQSLITYMGYRSLTPYNTTQLELLERWLSAHFYAMMDPTYASRSTDGSSGAFDGKTTLFLKGSRYGQMVMRLDHSGILEAWGREDRGHAAGAWLGGSCGPCSPWSRY